MLLALRLQTRLNVTQSLVQKPDFPGVADGPARQESADHDPGGLELVHVLEDEDFHLLARQMLWFMDPRLIKIVMKDDQPVGFMLAYPDVSAAIQKCQGKLLPLGWLMLLIELKRTKWININGAGMTDGYRGLGGTAILFSEMYKSVAKSRYRKADIVQIGTDNEAMLREMEGYGIKFYKTHRLYQKEL